MLTARMRECLSAIEESLCDRGVSPSYEELAEKLGMRAKSGVHRLIGCLEERGMVRRLPGRPRALEIIKPQGDLSPDYLRGFREGSEAENARLKKIYNLGPANEADPSSTPQR